MQSGATLTRRSYQRRFDFISSPIRSLLICERRFVKLPRDVSGDQIVKALQRLGFDFVRQRGSHARLVRGDRHITVPAHSAVAPGTLRNILRQAGIDLDEFLTALR